MPVELIPVYRCRVRSAAKGGRAVGTQADPTEGYCPFSTVDQRVGREINHIRDTVTIQIEHGVFGDRHDICRYTKRLIAPGEGFALREQDIPGKSVRAT